MEDFGVIVIGGGHAGLEAALASARIGVDTVMVTGNDDPYTADRALALGAHGYLTKPFVPNDLLISVAGAVHRSRIEESRSAQLELAYATIAASEEELRRAYAETVARLGRAMEFHDVETGEHVERVAESARLIAVELGLTNVVAERLRLAGPLHDIGKIAISEAILRKPGELSPDERGAMERHLSGRDFFVGPSVTLADISLFAYTHVAHEGGFELDAYPGVRAWIARVEALPGHVSITA